jgi:hypothetical protein
MSERPAGGEPEDEVEPIVVNGAVVPPPGPAPLIPAVATETAASARAEPSAEPATSSASSSGPVPSSQPDSAAAQAGTVLAERRSLFAEMMEHLPDDYRKEQLAFLERYHFDPNEPAVIGFALGADLRWVTEQIPDVIASSTDDAMRRFQNVSVDVRKAFELGIERTRETAGAFGAQQLTSFQVAFTKVATDVVRETTAAVKARALSPYGKVWALLVAVLIVGGSLGVGMWAGRAQGAEATRAAWVQMVGSAPEPVKAYVGAYRAKHSSM